jgi:hypothetical protein
VKFGEGGREDSVEATGLGQSRAGKTFCMGSDLIGIPES